MKNVTISLSNDLVQVLDSLCKDCDLSRYAFAKEALLEKIERHTKNHLEPQEKKFPDKTTDLKIEKDESAPPFLGLF